MLHMVAGDALASRGPAVNESIRIDRIELRVDAAIRHTLDWDELLTIGPGDWLTEDAVRQALSNLHATGQISDAALFVEDGALVVAVWGHTWIDAVQVSGAPAGLARDIRRALLGHKGQRWTVEHDARVEAQVARLLRERGFRQARTEVTFEALAAGSVALVCAVEIGDRYGIGSIAFTGMTGAFAETTLRAALALDELAYFDQERVGDAPERLRQRLVELGHLAARVGEATLIDDGAAQAVHLAFEIDVGPPMWVEVVGASEKALARHGLLPFGSGEPIDDGLLRQTCAGIREHLQGRGHYQARAQCGMEPADGDSTRILIEVEPGDRYQIEALLFEGNASIAAETLRPLLATSRARGWRRQPGYLIDSRLTADLDNLRSYYLLQGFADVEIGPARIELGAGRLTVTVPIHEGARRRVVDLTVVGAVSLDAEDLLTGLPLRAGGGPFHPALLEESVSTLRARFENAGLPDAVIEPVLSWSDDGLLVDVRFEVDEGRFAVVDRLVLRGHRFTQDAVIKRAMGLEPWTRVNRRRLLEAERDLHRLGIFSRVDVSLAPPNRAGGERDVVARLEEGKRWRLSYGVSYDSEDGVGGVLTATRNNLGGRGSRLRLDLRANREDQRFRLIFEQPRVTRLGLPLTYTLFFEDEGRDVFDITDRGLQIAARKEIGSLRLGLLYDFRIVDLEEETALFDPDDLRRGEVEISSLSPNLYIDRRDDPVEPTRGWTDFLQVTWAFPLASTEASFLKLFWQHAHIYDLGRAGTLATSIRLGLIDPIGDGGLEPDPAVPVGLPNALIPISERFFAGGRTSHRAFERDRLGVPGETLLVTDSASPDGRPLAIGGNALALWNLDYRFPIAGPVGGILFVDLGNVWADWKDIELDDSRPGAGLGVRYRSPIGPLRLEIGWNLDRQPGEDSPVLFLSFGNPF